jgi:hypothetical protein
LEVQSVEVAGSSFYVAGRYEGQLSVNGESAEVDDASSMAGFLLRMDLDGDLLWGFGITNDVDATSVINDVAVFRGDVFI